MADTENWRRVVGVRWREDGGRRPDLRPARMVPPTVVAMVYGVEIDVDCGIQ
jgi:hypothetical protein